MSNNNDDAEIALDKEINELEEITGEMNDDNINLEDIDESIAMPYLVKRFTDASDAYKDYMKNNYQYPVKSIKSDKIVHDMNLYKRICNVEFIGVPLDYDKDLLYKNDEYTYLFDNSKNDVSTDNYESNVLNGIIWHHGFIAYNQNEILIRDQDNMAGHKGFLSCMRCDRKYSLDKNSQSYYGNKLAKTIFHDYLIPTLIKDINTGKINDRTDVVSLKKRIITFMMKYQNEKSNIVNNNASITKDELFSDAPDKIELITEKSPIEQENIDLKEKIIKLESLVQKLSDRLDKLENPKSYFSLF
jgi:hypothetical protein